MIKNQSVSLYFSTRQVRRQRASGKLARLLFAGLFCLTLPWCAGAAEQLTIGINADKPPNSYFQDGRLTGAEHDIWMEAARRMGLAAQFKILPNARLVPELEMAAVGAVSVVPQDKDRPGVYYSATLLTIDNVVVVRGDSSFRPARIGDLAKVNFSIWQGGWNDLGEEFRQLFRRDPGSQQFPRNYSEAYSQYAQNQQFWHGGVEAMVISLDIFKWYRRAMADKADTGAPVRVYRLFAPTEMKAAFHDAAQRERFNKVLAEMRRDGSYKAIVAKYLPQQ